jgi:hypothetical protein
MSEKAHQIPEDIKKEMLREHLPYEISMLRWSAFKIPDLIMQTNTTIESFAVHARTLIDFFYYDEFIKTCKEDDILAEHYIARWRTIRPALTQTLKNAREKANKQLAHLTTLRATTYKDKEDKQWQFQKIHQELEKVIKIFNEALTN